MTRISTLVDCLIEGMSIQEAESIGHIRLHDLPHPIQHHIRNTLGLTPADVQVFVAPKVTPMDSYGNGHRAHFAMVHNAGEKPTRTTYGSWGGLNPFERNPLSVTAHQDREVPIPPGHSIVMGSSQKNVMGVWFHPDDIAKLLPHQETPDLGEHHFHALAAYTGLKPFARAEHFARRGVTKQHIDDLVDKKMLTRNKVGATQITTAGKNAYAMLKSKYKDSFRYYAD